MGARSTISTRQLAAAAVVVAAASLVRSPSAAAAAANKVGNYYGGGGGGTAKDYGVVFGPDAIGAVDSDAPGGSHLISNEPSPSTVALLEVSETDQLFVTVADGFTALYFQYAAFTGATVTLFDGPNLTGAVLGATNLPAVRDCSGGCEDPTGSIGVWDNVTACGQVGGPVSGTRLLSRRRRGPDAGGPDVAANNAPDERPDGSGAHVPPHQGDEGQEQHRQEAVRDEEDDEQDEGRLHGRLQSLATTATARDGTVRSCIRHRHRPTHPASPTLDREQ
jgi:hypothetical protein